MTWAARRTRREARAPTGKASVMATTSRAGNDELRQSTAQIAAREAQCALVQTFVRACPSRAHSALASSHAKIKAALRKTKMSRRCRESARARFVACMAYGGGNHGGQGGKLRSDLSAYTPDPGSWCHEIRIPRPAVAHKAACSAGV